MEEKVNLEISLLKEAGVLNTDLISDGYHTFEDLYYQRCVLFSIICNSNKDKAWKSKKHNDGSSIDGYFIVGIDTPEGQFTYHYQEMYWHLFNVKKLDKAPEWDGHNDDDVIRLFSLGGE